MINRKRLLNLKRFLLLSCCRIVVQSEEVAKVNI
jgi:hypothetical protein